MDRNQPTAPQRRIDSDEDYFHAVALYEMDIQKLETEKEDVRLTGVGLSSSALPDFTNHLTGRFKAIEDHQNALKDKLNRYKQEQNVCLNLFNHIGQDAYDYFVMHLPGVNRKTDVRFIPTREIEYAIDEPQRYVHGEEVSPYMKPPKRNRVQLQEIGTRERSYWLAYAEDIDTVFVYKPSVR